MNIRESSMIKFMIYLFLCIFILSSCKENTTSDLDIFNLKGKVKSVTYNVYHEKEYYQYHDWTNYCVGMPTYTREFTYEFDENGNWINSHDNIERDTNGRIINLGNKSTFIWDENGKLAQQEMHDWLLEGPGTSIEYHYDNNGNIKYLQYNDGSDGGQEHTYIYEGESDGYGNWLLANVDRRNPEFDYDHSSITIERTITYWNNSSKEDTSIKNILRGIFTNSTKSFNESIKDRKIVFRRPFDGEYYESLLFYPISETQGRAVLKSFYSDMNHYNNRRCYDFSYIINDGIIHFIDGVCREKSGYMGLFGEYGKHEDFKLKINYDNNGNVKLNSMSSNAMFEQYKVQFDLDKNR